MRRRTFISLTGATLLGAFLAEAGADSLKESAKVSEAAPRPITTIDRKVVQHHRKATRNHPEVTGGDHKVAHGRHLTSHVTSPDPNVGPNALLKSTNYPPASSSSPGPLTPIVLPKNSDLWRIQIGSPDFTLPHYWESPDATYVYNNDAANLGGVVPPEGMIIDGLPVEGGTYVFQFMDLSAGYCYFTNPGPSVMFRGCRRRTADITAPGFINSTTGYQGSLYVHYCDLGGLGALNAEDCALGISIQSANAFRAFRNYISYVTYGIQPNLTPPATIDVIENFIEKLTLFYGLAGPPSGQGMYHINGIKLDGGQGGALILRNKVVTAAVDDAGHPIRQTDCIGFIQSFADFPGTGINSDGSTGYWVVDNFVGGTGYCFYLGTGPRGPIANLHWTGNEVTTSSYATGGYFGPVTSSPVWNTNGNVAQGNIWADGPKAGKSIGKSQS